MAESAAAVAVPKGVQKLDGDSILYIKKKALTTYEKRLKKRPQKLKYIIYGIDMSNPELLTVEVSSTGGKTKTLDDLCATLAKNNHVCHYVIYDHEFKTDDGRTTDQLYFITWVPPASSTKSRTLFANGKQYMEKHFEGTLPFQASNVSDLKSHFGVDEEDTDSDWDPDA